MTLERDHLSLQLDWLKQSLLTLSDLAGALPVDPRLSGTIRELASQLSPAPAERGGPAGLRQILDLLPQVRASLSLIEVEDDGTATDLHSNLNELELEVGRHLRLEQSARVYGLYVIIDPEVTGGRPPLQVTRGALRGGAKMVQLRDKLSEKGHTLALARSMKDLCDEYDALLIINDHPDLAALTEAGGLHVGQGDLPVKEARRILASGQIIGRSNHLLEEALESEAQGADHVALGNVYATSTKVSIRGRAPTGTEVIRKLKEAVGVPVVAIGGINEENLGPVVQAGADAVCVASAVGLAPDPEEASRRLVQRILEAGGKA